jgi:hypothetical protein
MKLLGHLITTSKAAPNRCIISTPRAVGNRRIRLRISDPLHKKEARALSNKGQTSIIGEEAHQAEVGVTTEAHTYKPPYCM